MIFEKEALDDPSLITLNTNITISKMNSTSSNTNLTSGKTSLLLYVPKFAILKASSLNSNYDLNLNNSNPICRQSNSLSNFDTYVSKHIIKFRYSFIQIISYLVLLL